MEDSILKTIKKLVSLPADYDVFDMDLVLHINAVFSTLQQLGIGPKEGFAIEDAEAKWSDFLEDDPRFNAVKSYMGLRVRMLFDPPATSFTQTAFKEQIAELEWRLNVTREEDKWTTERKAQLILLNPELAEVLLEEQV